MMSDGATDSASAQRAALTPDEKRAKLRALLERRAAGTRSAPLSAGQERLWALERIEPGNRAYVETGSFRFSATLDLRAVQRALDDILRRHEILRTTIAVEDGQPVQRIAAELPVRLEVEDLRELPVVQHGAALREQLRELVERAFDFERGPLWRTKVVRLGDKQHVVLVAIHHMLCDGFSIRLLLAELFELYAAHRLGQPARLPAPVAQYADFARWQRRWLESDAFTSELDFWRRTLAGPIPVVELPPDRPRGDAPRRFRGARLRFEVPDRVYDALRARATEANATPFVVLLAAFDLLLHAYTGECDIAVATPVAGRDRPEFERVVGFFANSVVLRSDLSGDPTFLALLARVRETVLGALSHQRAPVERVLKELGVASTPGHSRLVRAGIALLPAWTDHLHAPGYDVEVLDLDSGTSRIELALMLWQGASTLSGTVEYDTDLYDASTVERFVDHYVRLLGALVRDPLRRASAGIPLDDGEARALEQRRERWREAHASAPAGAVRSGPAARALSARASPAGELGARASLRAPARRDPDAELEQLCERSNLTRNQLLVWLGQRAQPELPLYNIPVFFHMDVGIDVGPFRRALQGLVDACEVLRTVFDEVEGLPQRRVLPHFEVEVPLHDLSRERDPDAALEAFAEARRGVKFSPSRPMFETALLVLGPRRTVWYFNQHHLIGDGRSAVLLLRALDELYRGARAGADLALELPTFDAFAREERALRGTPRWDAARRHWREALADPPPPLWFHARSLGARSTKVRRITLALGTRRSARLIGAARALGGASEKQALYHAVAAALFAWLHRMSGNRRLAIGSPLANRVGRSHKHTPGLFMQVVPIALEIAADETLRSLARKVARELRGAMRHQRYATANPADRPFYEVGLNVHVARTAPFDGAPLRSDWRHPGHEHELLAVQIRDFDGTGELSLDFDAREDRFDAAEARRGAERLVALLDALIEDPDRRVDALEMPDAAERRQLVDELNRTPSLAAEDPIALFQRAVDRHAARTAVVDGDLAVTYADLERRANQLAHHLTGMGIGPEHAVAVLATRSLDYVVGVLGALTAGAMCVPIDPAHPDARIAAMIARSHARAVLLQRACEPRLRDLEVARVALDGEACAWRSAPATRRGVRGPASRAGYAIFTSGSTGEPHAVVITAQSLGHYAATAAQIFALEPADRVLQFAALSFDTAFEELFPTLISGAALVLRDDAMIAAPEDFLARCGERGITVVNLPTSYWHAVAERTPREHAMPASIRLVVVGGERVLRERLRAWFRGPGRGVRLLNGYGPTEATIVATFAELGEADGLAGAEASDPGGTNASPRAVDADRAIDSAVRIGRPIADARVYILDDQLRPLPRGVVGELWIGGAGVARGYLDEPELTAERFRADPFGPAGAYLYRSGDMCRWGDDGELRFLGRADAQLKIGGFRVEPGEVEAALLAQPGVREAAVAARDEAGRARLCAWVVAAGDALDVDALRARLRERLPDPFVPAAVVAVASLPRLPNGKLDRGALLALADEPADAFAAPRSAREQALAAVWCEAFGLERVSVDANFFDLGGDSLIAVRVLHLAQRAGICFEPRQIFECGTIAALAAVSTTSEPPAAVTAAPTAGEPLAARGAAADPTQAGGRCALVELTGAIDSRLPLGTDAPPLFLFHAAGGDLQLYRFLVRELAGCAPLVGIESSLPAGPGTAHDSIEAMARSYRALVRGRQPRGPYRLLGWSMGGMLALEVARQLEEQGDVVDFLALLDDSASAGVEPAALESDALADRIVDLLRAESSALDAARAATPGDARPQNVNPARVDSDAETRDAVGDGASPGSALEEQVSRLLAVVGALPAADRARAVAAWLVERGLASPQGSAGALEARLLRFEQHGGLCVAHRPAPVHAAVHRFCTVDSSRREPPPALAGSKLEVVRGNHYTMLLPPHVSDLAARIRSALSSGAGAA